MLHILDFINHQPQPPWIVNKSKSKPPSLFLYIIFFAIVYRILSSQLIVKSANSVLLGARCQAAWPVSICTVPGGYMLYIGKTDSYMCPLSAQCAFQVDKHVARCGSSPAQYHMVAKVRSSPPYAILDYTMNMDPTRLELPSTVVALAAGCSNAAATIITAGEIISYTPQPQRLNESGWGWLGSRLQLPVASWAG